MGILRVLRRRRIPSWSDAVKYGFVSAGGGTWYSKTLRLLSPGDRIWVKVPGAGFVGVGRVTGPPEPTASFRVKTDQGEVPTLDVATGGHYHRHHADDPERCEYFVPVDWLQTAPVENAVDEIGLFGDQNTVCKPTTPKWRYTIDRLKQRFPGLTNRLRDASQNGHDAPVRLTLASRRHLCALRYEIAGTSPAMTNEPRTE